MTITLGTELESALKAQADNQGISPETLALNALRDRFLANSSLLEPRDAWERKLREAASDCGISLSDWDVSREAIYD